MPSDTLPEIIERVRTDIELNIEGADAHVALGGFNEQAVIFGGLMYALHRKIEWLEDQIFTDTADEEHLLREAALYLEVPRVEAAYASGNVDLTGTNGAEILFGEILQNGDLVEYRVILSATIAGGIASVKVLALQAGVAGNLLFGESLTFSSPIIGVESTAAVDALEITGGADLESVERVRDRLSDRKKQPPEGGGKHDYIAWGKAAHVDVTRVWPFPHENGDGSMTVRFVTDNAATVLPAAAVITAVTDYINIVKPYGLKSLSVEAPSAVNLDITFSTLDPNTAEVQAAIAAELTDLLARKAEPGATLYLSQIREAISRAADENDYVIDLSDNIIYTNSQVGVLGTITWP